MTPGKRWENNVQESLGKRCIRLYDTTNGFVGIKNPCDFIYYSYPNRIMIECKSVEGNTLPFSIITENQLDSLTQHSKEYGVITGIAVEFRKDKKCYYIPIQVVNDISENRRKSITVDMCREHPCIVDLNAKYRRTNCTFNDNEFSSSIQYVVKVKLPKEGL